MYLRSVERPLGPNGPATGLVISARHFHKADGLLVSTVLVGYLDPKVESGMGFVLHVAKSVDGATPQHSHFLTPTLDCAREIVELIAKAPNGRRTS